MSGLIRYEAARAALQSANSVDEVKDLRDKAQAMAAYARQAKDTELVGWATEIKVRAERRAGEMLIVAGKNGSRPLGRPEKESQPTTLSDLGVSRDQSSRWQKLAAVPEAQFEQAVAAAKEVAGEVTTAAMLRLNGHNHRAQGTGENEWYTPAEYVELARKCLGEIDIDPASSDAAQKVVKAAVYYTQADDGLIQTWKGRMWLNPPYAQPAIQQFIEKAVAEYSCGNVKEAVILTHNYTDTAWFQLAAKQASAICFTRGRIGFLSPEGTRAAPTQGQAFFYFGSLLIKFRKAFADTGFVMVRP